jgi:hypothetical protein
MWMEPRNYESATARIYGRRYPFPLSFILPRRERAAVQARLEAFNLVDKDHVRAYGLDTLGDTRH